MAKVGFTTLINIKSIEDKNVTINGKEVVVKQYLPVSEKAELLDYVIQSSFDTNGLLSPIRYNLYYKIGILRWYTNISFTEAMLQNIEKTYDAIVINGLYEDIIKYIPEKELQNIKDMISWACGITGDYISSFAGQLRATQTDYNNTTFDLEKIAETLQDPKQIGLVKELMEKMG